MTIKLRKKIFYKLNLHKISNKLLKKNIFFNRKGKFLGKGNFFFLKRKFKENINKSYYAHYYYNGKS